MPRTQNAKSAATGRATPVVEPTAETNLPKTKSGQVLALLQRPDGATLAELISATNWKPHTTRAALTGLRKKGHAIVKGKRGEVTCYNVPAAA